MAAMAFLSWLLFGLVVGAIARFLGPSPRGIGCLGTIALGLVGSVVGGALFNILFEGNLDAEPSGFIGSIVGAVVVLLGFRLLQRR